MTRIDHAAEALIFERSSDAVVVSAQQAMAPHMIAVIELDKARLHAQLALVEQQRIANIIAWTTRDGQTPIAEVRNIIAEGLGL